MSEGGGKAIELAKVETALTDRSSEISFRGSTTDLAEPVGKPRSQLAKSRGGINSAAQIEDGAFHLVLLVVLIDQIGIHFTSSVVIPLSITLGATATDVGYLFSARYAGALLSGFLLPMVADTKGRTIAIRLSACGSCLGYLIQGLSLVPNDPKTGWLMLMVGKVIDGMFSQTMPVCMAYLADLCLPDLVKLRKRITATFGLLRASAPTTFSPSSD
jgi:MFS family permease